MEAWKRKFKNFLKMKPSSLKRLKNSKMSVTEKSLIIKEHLKKKEKYSSKRTMRSIKNARSSKTRDLQ